MIHAVCGLNIQDFYFTTGTRGDVGQLLFKDCMQIGMTATGLKMFDAGLHPKKVAEKFQEIIDYRCSWEHGEIYLSVCTDVIPNIIGYMIHEKTIRPEDVELILLNASNSAIIGKFQYTSDGVISDDWPFGFFSWTGPLNRS